MDYAALAKQYGGSTQAVPPPVDYAKLAAEYGGVSHSSKALPPQEGGAMQTATDAGNAVGTGFFRGLVKLAGTPVDAVANVVDLGKAGLGSAYTAATGKPAPDALQLGDRSQVVGSGDWLLNQARKNSAGRFMVDPSNPEYEGGYLQNTGAALSGVMGGGAQTLPQLANNALLNVTGATAGKAVYDKTGNQALAISASMLPLAAQSGATELAKRAVRGDESGRRAMEQRVQDLKNAGVENPTLGLASGNKLVGGVENMLQSTPGAVDIMRRNRDAAVGGLESSAGTAADLASTNRGAIESGRSIQSGAQSFKEGFKAQQADLYNKLDQYMSPSTPVVVNGTKNALYDLTATDRAAPNLSARFVNGKINSLRQDFDLDTGLVQPNGSRTSTAPVLRDQQGAPITRSTTVQWGTPGAAQAVGGEGSRGADIPARSGSVVRTISIPGEVSPVQIGEVSRTTNPLTSVAGEGRWRPPANPVLPYGTVKQLRTQVGSELSDASLVPDVPSSQWKRLYAGMSGDLGNAAQATGPEASSAWSRANDYTRSGLDRLERIAPIIDRPAPEQTFSALASTLKENNSTFQAVKKSLPQDARGDFAGTVIERLGRASPGQQDETGAKWSPETFLTNWSRIAPQARNELLSGIPNAGEVKGLVDSVAKATAMMRDNSKMWANPSGTASNAAARGVLGLVGAGGAGALAGIVNPLVPLGAAASLGGVNLLARGVTSPMVRGAMMRQTNIDPALTNALAASLAARGQLQQPNQQQR